QLNDVISGVERMLRTALGEDVTLRLDLDPEVPTVAADHGQLEQVLLNLAVNARDALPQGGRLTITTKRVPAKELKDRISPNASHADYVLLSVEDTGTGMTEEV